LVAAIRLDDGSTVEVSLDQTFKVIGSQVDEDSSTDQEGASDN
jgi:hypothetical protein